MDYVDESAELDPAPEHSRVVVDDKTPAEGAIVNAIRPEASDNEQVDAASFLSSLLPPDPNTRRRVVTALLRAVLADRKIT